jgi:hypothetical protein
VPSAFLEPHDLIGLIDSSSESEDSCGWLFGIEGGDSNMFAVRFGGAELRLLGLLPTFTRVFAMVLDRESVSDLVFSFGVAIDQCAGSVENRVNGVSDVESETAFSESSPDALNFCSSCLPVVES